MKEFPDKILDKAPRIYNGRLKRRKRRTRVRRTRRTRTRTRRIMRRRTRRRTRRGRRQGVQGGRRKSVDIVGEIVVKQQG